MNERNDLTQGVIWKKLIIYFLPILAGNLFQQLYNAVDAIVVSKYVGTQALASVAGSSANILNVLVGFFVSLGSGATVILAQEYGAKNYSSVSKVVHTGVTFCIAAGIGLTLVCTPFITDMLVLLKTPQDTIEMSKVYLTHIFRGCAFGLLFNMGSGMLRASGDSKSPFVFLFISCVTNIILDISFVKFFDMGVAGVAIATVIAQGLSSVLILIKLGRSSGPDHFEIKKLGIDFPTLKKMMRIGIPAGLQGSMYAIANLIQAIAVNTLGTTIVASWSLSGKIDGIYWSTSNAAGVAIQNFIAQNYGAGNSKRVKDCVGVSMKLFISITVALCTLILCFGQVLLPFFSDDPAVIENTWLVIIYFVPFYFIWTLVEIFSSVLRGAGDAYVPTVINALGVCVSRIVWVYTAFAKYSTLLCISLSYPVSWIITAVPLIIRYKSGKWNNLPPAA